MQQKKEISQASSPKKQKRNSLERKVSQTQDRKNPQTRKNKVEDNSQGFKGKYSSNKSPGPEKSTDSNFQKKRNLQRFEYEDDHIGAENAICPSWGKSAADVAAKEK